MWTIDSALSYSVFDGEGFWATIASRMIYVTTLFCFLFANAFFLHYPQKITCVSQGIGRLVTFATLTLACVFLFTPMLVKEMKMMPELGYSVEIFGIGYVLYVVYQFALLMSSYVFAVVQYRRSIFLNKMRMQLVLVGYTVFWFSTVLLANILPLFEVYVLLPWIVACNLPFILLTTLAMHRYQFMNIKVLMRKIIQVTCTVVIALGVGYMTHQGIGIFQTVLIANGVGTMFLFTPLMSMLTITFVAACTAVIMYHIFYRLF